MIPLAIPDYLFPPEEMSGPALRDWIGHIHLSDFRSTGWTDRPLPGGGEIDFGAALRSARAIHYGGLFTIEGVIPSELAPIEACAQTAAYLHAFDTGGQLE